MSTQFFAIAVAIPVVQKADNTEEELEFDMDLTLCPPRTFRGATGTHKWRASQVMFIPGKVDIKIGDQVVVVGSTDKGKVHIIDPAFYHVDNAVIKTFTVLSDIIASPCTFLPSPESL